MKAILTILLIFGLFFYLLPWVVRTLLRWKIRSMQRQMSGQAQARTRQRRAPKEGEIRVDTGRTPHRKINDRIGDYVEYEEITIVEEGEKTEK